MQAGHTQDPFFILEKMVVKLEFYSEDLETEARTGSSCIPPENSPSQSLLFTWPWKTWAPVQLPMSLD